MDEELRNYLATMETRLIRQINDGQERILNRLTTLEAAFSRAIDDRRHGGRKPAVHDFPPHH